MKKSDKQLSYMLKLQIKKVQEQRAEEKALKRKLAGKKLTTHTCGCHSELPTDHNWKAYSPRNSRFVDDKRVKGHNGALQYMMLKV